MNNQETKMAEENEVGNSEPFSIASLVQESDKTKLSRLGVMGRGWLKMFKREPAKR